jgi:hypothetical protein
MTYSRQDFGRDLLSELDEGYDVVRLSRWAMSVYMQQCQKTEPELDKLIMSIVAMEEGPEFEYKEPELRELASQLIQGS